MEDVKDLELPGSPVNPRSIRSRRATAVDIGCGRSTAGSIYRKPSSPDE